VNSAVERSLYFARRSPAAVPGEQSNSAPSLCPAPKNKVEIGVLFFAPQKCPVILHVCHTTHHKFTTKTPQQNAISRKIPSKNAYPPRGKNPAKNRLFTAAR
jgi:hypothetical protein